MSCSRSWGRPFGGPFPQRLHGGAAPQSLSGVQEAGTATGARGETGPPADTEAQAWAPEATCLCRNYSTLPL